MHSQSVLILASGSEIRKQLLLNAGLSIDVVKPMVDEEALKLALQAENASPRDIADGLAEMKAARIGNKHPNSLVLGCDQVLEFEKHILSKPVSKEDAKAQLSKMSGKRHSLLSAAVIFHELQPIWRHVGQVRLYMRTLSDAFIEQYVERNWPDIAHCVGGYQIEREGARLFSRIDGDIFNVMGLPLLELLNYLTLRGDIDG
jgi:septum formation protein